MFHETLSENQLLTDLPESIQISRHKGIPCCTSEVSKVALAELISANTVHNTGFLYLRSRYIVVVRVTVTVSVTVTVTFSL